MEGWIKIHRNILDDEVFMDAELFKVFVWCVLKANSDHRTIDVYGSKVKRGEFVTGRTSASDDLRMKPSSVYDRIKKLEKLKYIDIKSNTKHSVIKIRNYNKYQSVKDDLSTITERLSKFKQDVMSWDSLYDEVILEAFISYWSEPNRSNSKMRFELQPTWNTKMRLATWVKNDDKYNHKTGKTTSSVETLITNYKNTIEKYERGEDIF